MLSNEEIAERFQNLDEVYHVEVNGDGYRYTLILVTDEFTNKSKVARQQWVYKHLRDVIANGSLHALSMHTWTKEEWEKQRG